MKASGNSSKRKGIYRKAQHLKPDEETGFGALFFRKPLIHVLMIILLGLAVYSNTFNSPLLFDDESAILRKDDIKDIGYITRMPISLVVAESRLIGYITFAVNYAAHGLDVTGYHIVNIAIHLLCALLVYWLVLLTFLTPYFPDDRSVKTCSSRYFTALFAALLFISHPIQTQAVTYIVQRYASLTTLFYLLSLTMYIKSRLSESVMAKYGFYAGALASALLAMKTKEIAFTLPLAIIFYEYIFFSGNAKKRLFYLSLFVIAMFFIPLALIIANGHSLTSLSSIVELTKMAGDPDVSRWDYLYTQFRVIVTYIRLLFLPVSQNLDYDYPIYRTFFTAPVFLSFSFLLSVIGWGVYLLFRASRSDKKGREVHWLRLIAFGIFWFFLTLSVESSIIPIADVIFEHRLYLPSVGFFIAVMACVMWMRNRMGNKPFVAKAVLAVMVLVVAGLSVTAYARNAVWQDEVTLWADAVSKSPNKDRVKYNFHESSGRAYLARNNYPEAFSEFKAALLIRSDFADPHKNMGNLYFKLGRYDEALTAYQTALGFPSDYSMADVHFNIGEIYYSKGNMDQAIKEFEMLISVAPYKEAAKNRLKTIKGGTAPGLFH